MNVETVISFLSLLTLSSNILLALVILVFLLSRANKDAKTYWKRLNAFLSNKVLLFAFIVSLVATSGSLYLSEIAKFTPCILCWYQRIFMYPLVLILGVALYKKAKDVKKYVLALSLVGLSIATYHYILQIFPEQLAPCSAVGFSVSCSQRFVTSFGYITIPFMSLSAFALITFFMLINKEK